MARDTFHNAVRAALENEQWIITDDPLEIVTDVSTLEVDLGAEQNLLAAEQDGLKIAVEIKSFVSASLISEWHTALGQFINYRDALADSQPDRKLYLAVPVATYNSFFQSQFIQQSVQRHKVALIVYNPVQQELVQWLPL